MDEVDINDLTDRPGDMLINEAARDYSGRRRQPQAKWFSSHPWLRISRHRKVLHCSWCREMGNRRLVGACKVESPFVDKRFNNWKDGSLKLDEHAASSSHRAAAECVSNRNKPSVATQLSCQLAKEQQVNRNRFVVQRNSLLTMGQERLNSIMMANVHLDLIDSINIVSVANEFAGLNDSRRKLYGHFS